MIRHMHAKVICNESEQLLKLQGCLKDIKSWMISKFLLNPDKTEVILFGPKHLKDRLDHIITLHVICLPFSFSVRNFEVTFDQDLSPKVISRRVSFIYETLQRSGK